ncbi:MAG: hypothetical protein O3B47_00950 [bacterium]|nr:hypothetical protein [bacterium]
MTEETDNKPEAQTEAVAEVKKDEAAIIFYCKDCAEIVDTTPIGRKYVYKCKKCGTKNVAFGTPKSIRGFFRMDENEKKDKNDEKGEDSKVMTGAKI